ncbi:MAG: hypothetical protein WDZ40_02960 [Candidatus Spechtbacterales bacterium]
MKFFKLVYLLFTPRLSTEEVGKKIVDKATRSAFRVFRDNDFRKLVKFSEISQTEQDRIFNELVVNAVVLAVLMTETRANQIEDSNFSRSVRILSKAIKKRYPEMLQALGVTNQQHIDMWHQLIDMRIEEYRKYEKDMRNDVDEATKHIPWLPIVITGTVDHIRRGKLKEGDTLFKIISSWLGPLLVGIQKVMFRLER